MFFVRHKSHDVGKSISLLLLKPYSSEIKLAKYSFKCTTKNKRDKIRSFFRIIIALSMNTSAMADLENALGSKNNIYRKTFNLHYKIKNIVLLYNDIFLALSLVKRIS